MRVASGPSGYGGGRSCGSGGYYLLAHFSNALRVVFSSGHDVCLFNRIAGPSAARHRPGRTTGEWMTVQQQVQPERAGNAEPQGQGPWVPILFTFFVGLNGRR